MKKVTWRISALWAGIGSRQVVMVEHVSVAQLSEESSPAAVGKGLSLL